MSEELHDAHPERLHQIVQEGKKLTETTTVEPSLADKLDAFETAWHQQARELLGKIPDWVPLIKPYLEAKMLLEGEASAALFRGRDVQKGEQIETWKERIQRFAELEIKALLHNGEAAIDAVLLFGTFGTGTVVAEGGELAMKAAIKEAAKKGGLKALKEVIQELSNPEGGEIKFLSIMGKAVEGALPFIEDEKARSGAEQVVRLFSILTANDDTLQAMENFLKGNESWQQMKESFAQAGGNSLSMKDILAKISGLSIDEITNDEHATTV